MTHGMLLGDFAFPAVWMTGGEETVVRNGVVTLDNQSLMAFPAQAVVVFAALAAVFAGFPVRTGDEDATVSFVAGINRAVVRIVASSGLLADADAIIIA